MESAPPSGQAQALRAFRALGSVGPVTAQTLWDLGFRAVPDLAGASPEQMYARTHALQGGGYLDRCVLYVYRCVVYQACTPDPDPELCKWWNWKDRTFPSD